MIKLEMKNYNMILREKLAFSSSKINKYEYLTSEKVFPSNQKQIIEQVKFTYFPLGKAFKEQKKKKKKKKQVKAIKGLNIFDKANELKQTESLFPQKLLNELISNKLKKFIELQNSIELDKPNYENYDFNKVSLSYRFLRDKYANDLSIENSDNEQNDLFKMFRNLNKGRKSPEKIFCLKNVKILLKAREDVLVSFKSNLFPIMLDTTSYTTPRKRAVNEDSFINEIVNDEKI